MNTTKYNLTALCTCACNRIIIQIQYIQTVSPYRLMADQHKELIFLLKKIQIAVFLKVCPRTIMGGYVAYDITMQITGQVD